MASITHFRTRHEGLTLERAILVALALHALFALALDRWPGLLSPAEVATPTPPPLRFRLVESPAETAEAPPPTDVLSDRDRLASDRSPADDAEQPLLQGNTDQMTLGATPSPAAPTGGEPSVSTAPTPDAAPAEATAAEAEPAEAEAESAVSEVLRAPEKETTPATEPQPEARPVPPRRSRLRGQLARLESLVDPQVFDNAKGGAPDRGSLAQFDTRGYELGPYLQKVLETIKRNWYANIPPLIRTGVQGATFVALTIRRERRPDGEEVAVIVPEQTWSSSQPAYDSAALFALELSSPLPPIPDFYPYDTITGRLGFLYNIRDTREVRFPGQ